MKIALDVDGVLADVIQSWLNYSNSIRQEIQKHEITDWNFWKKFDIDRYDFYSELRSCWKNWISIPPTEENLASITKNLSDIGQVDIVTARERSTDSFVKKWLEYHNISYDNYVPVIDGPMKADLDYDVFIDDSPLNALKFLQNNKNIILYSQPWNQHIVENKIHRISNLSEAIKKLN
ncbi:putative nucleotidase YqfW protein [Marine Group I thaumarchaeote SCGC AAA799-B03]|uniref:Putative nucleotidase YqfW protein n=1 Tax=Marine Group I thaumarchaeote SCGC AAA799-B03 TaxID=1502289 RepID=A0A087S934_9ARCH|nr:putative nucleotidase YqfW protein [Marine Group I thaumarchaeote SCGC AAA799-B03]